MKLGTHNLYLSFVVLCQMTIITHCQNKTGVPDPNTSSVRNISDFKDTAFDVNKRVANLLFNPVGQDGKTPDPFPTDSSQVQKITTLASALKLDSTTTDHLKKCYFYLEYVTKLELAAKYITYFENKNLGDPVALLKVPEPTKQDSASLQAWAQTQLAAWKNLAQKGGLSSNLVAIEAIAAASSSDWVLLESTVLRALGYIPHQQLAQTDFWKSITIQDPSVIMLSNFWQNYLQYQITDLFDQDSNLIKGVVTAETLMFPFIPTMETAYYDENFTHLRYSAEMTRLHLLLTDRVRDRLIDQVPAWKALSLHDVYQKAQDFKLTPFYKMVKGSTNDVNGTMQAAISGTLILDKILPNQADRDALTQAPLFYEELLALGMIKNLQATLFNLFNKDNLENTMKVFRTTPRPLPDIFLYTQDDYVYLEDINMIFNYFLTGEFADIPAQPHDETVTTQGWTDDVASAASDTWHDLTRKAKRSAKKIHDDAILFSTAIPGALKSADSATQKALKDKLNQFKDSMNKSFRHGVKDLPKNIKDWTDLAKKWEKDIGKGKDVDNPLDNFLRGLGIQSDLVVDVEKLGAAVFNTGVDTLRTIADFAAMVIIDATTVFKFSSKTVPIILAHAISRAITDITTGNLKDLGNIPDNTLNDLKEAGAAVLNTFLTEIMVVAGDFLQVIGDVLQGVAYLTTFVANILIEAYQLLYAGISGALRFVGKETGWSWATQAGSALAEQATDIGNFRSTVVGVINTAVLIGATIATDGASLAALAMNGGMQAPQVVTSIQQDIQNNETLHLQSDLVASYSLFIDATILMSSHQQKNLEDELAAKFNAEVANNERGLGFIQNYYNETFDNYKAVLADSLGAAVAEFLTPEPIDKGSNIAYVPLEVGSTYGFTTGLYNLNPSQGIALYNPGRKTFSQEVAVSPLMAQDTVSKFWFLQKETMPLTAPVQEVELRIRSIYKLKTFYMGIYFGGSPINIQELITKKKLDLDAARFAKMLVFKRTPETGDNPLLALYEHEGKGDGWFSPNPTGPAFENGVWYRMKMNVSGTTLKVKAWKEGASEPAWQTFTAAQPTDQTTVGVISSGVAVEYELVTPKPTIALINEAFRPKADPKSYETYRELDNRIQLDYSAHPVNGAGAELKPLNLNIIDQASLLKGNFIYTTTALKKPQDYVVVAEYVTSEDVIASNPSTNKQLVGIDPASGKQMSANDPFGAISLIDNQLYDKNGTAVISDKGQLVKYSVWPDYVQTQSGLSDAVRTTINTQRSKYIDTLLASFKFGAFDLKATSSADLAQNMFIYTGPSKNNELTEMKQQDFLVLAQLDKRYPPDVYVGSKRWINPDGSPDGLLSLVTGNLYNKDGTLASKDADMNTVIRDLATYVNSISPATMNSIKAATTAYNNYVTQKKIAVTQATKAAADAVKTVTTVLNNIAGGSARTTTTPGTANPPASTPSGSSSTQQKNDAAPDYDDF